MVAADPNNLQELLYIFIYKYNEKKNIDATKMI